LRREFASCAAVRVTQAMPYDAFVHALSRCDFALTDSGGVQEESAALGKPVLVVRDVTERLEGIEDGVSWMVGRSREGIVAALVTMATSRERRRAMSRPSLSYGDGLAAERVAARLVVGADICAAAMFNAELGLCPSA
jgi:UDP-N-acetylglucosamine 2-epimerase (non-hydrolysing)